MRASGVFLSILLGFVSSFSQLFFVDNPSLSKDNGNQWWVEFSVSESTDVAISIVNIKDSTVIRNLAAGVLGSNAPAPLTPGSLHQKLAWDGKDNYGQTVNLPDSIIRARVRAGMSPKLTAFMGGDPYAFASSFHGIRMGPDNTVYVCAGNAQAMYGSYIGGNRPVRRFDADGNYQRTLFPPAADLPLDSVLSYGVNSLAGGGWAPMTNVVNFATMTKSLLTQQDVQLLPFGKDDELLLTTDNSIQTLRLSGAAAAQDTPRALNPAPVNGYYESGGPAFFAPTHDSRYLYLSGRYGCYYLAGGELWAHDTGFWAEGQVFKVEKATGRVTPWLHIDSFPVTKTERLAVIGDDYKYYSALHGVDIDDSGHVFVCNRVNKTISVYDTNAVFLGSIPLNWPDAISVNRLTHEIYATARNRKGITLYKFPGWRGVTQPLCSLSLAVSSYQNSNKPFIAQYQKDGHTMLLIGANESSYGSALWMNQYRDDGNSIVPVKEFLKAAGKDDLINFNRIAVDRRNETVFIQDRNEGLFKITDWSNPAAVRCSTSAHKPMLVDDMAVDPRRGFLYVHEITPYPGTYAGPITRWTLDHLHAPAPYANTGDNMLTPYLQTGDVQGHPSKGMDISLTGNTLLCMGEHSYAGQFIVTEFPDTGSHDTLVCDTMVIVPGQSGGVKYDLKDNYYFGSKTRSSDHVVPTGFVSDFAYQVGVGSVLKYQAGIGGHSMGAFLSSRGIGSNPPPTDALKVYAPGFAPFGGNMTNGCTCTSPRFDLDYYGRLFIPNAITKQVTVTDNNGNIIMQFGEYGNLDSRGGLPGPGLPVLTPAFPLAYPVSAAASEDYIYVGDVVNWRMMRVRMDYEMDNLPGLTDGHTGGMDELKYPSANRFTLSSAPNPFNPQSRITVYVPKRMPMTLTVYDFSGKKVRDIAAGSYSQGLHQFVWQGNDAKGKQAASGIYLFRLTAGAATLQTKAILAK